MFPGLVASRGEITEAIIGAAMEVNRALGPGLLESAFIGSGYATNFSFEECRSSVSGSFR